MSRRCGPCTFCCTAAGVPELNKPAGVPCEHITPEGCAIYEDRPESCRDFECAWLQGATPKQARPDLAHGLVRPTEKGNIQIMVVDDRWRRHPYFRRLVNDARNDRKALPVFVVHGAHRRITYCHPGNPQFGQVMAYVRDGADEDGYVVEVNPPLGPR